MPYYTPLPDATIDLTATTPVVSLGTNLLLNELYASTEFNQYDVDSGSGTTLTRGDDVSLVDDMGNDLLADMLYAGTATFSTAAISLNLSGIKITIQVNPIEGHLLVDPDTNQVYMVTDQPLDKDHLGVTASIKISGNTTNLVDVSISDLLNNPLLSLVRSNVQTALDTAIVNIAYDPNGTLTLDDDDVLPCFTLGTLIQRDTGLVTVESLKVGDLVMTRDNGLQGIRWIGSVKVSAARLARSPDLRPVRIKAGALGTGVPASDLLVSPQHRVMVRSKIAQRLFGTDEVLVAAKQLLQLDGFDIAEDQAEVEYFHILFDRHEIVISNGAATESLYTGGEALKSVGAAAREEIFTLFPELRDGADLSPAARPLSSGRMARKLAVRHMQHGKPLYH